MELTVRRPSAPPPRIQATRIAGYAQPGIACQGAALIV